jgi:DNA-binding NarL/FixJ family response regulator
MSTATLVHTRRAGAPTVVIVGGDVRERGNATRLLDDAAFGIEEESAPADLVILIGELNEAARLRAIRTLTEERPDARVIVVVPTGARNASLRRSLLAGASGIVLESELAGALVATARAVLVGQLTVPGALGRQIAPRPLSHREKQILGLVVQGLTNREIASRLYLAESTVKTHLSSAFRKIDARSRSEAVARIQDPDSGYGMGILAVVEAPSTG